MESYEKNTKEKFTTSIDPELLNKLREICKARNYKLNTYIEYLIERGLDECDKDLRRKLWYMISIYHG